MPESDLGAKWPGARIATSFTCVTAIRLLTSYHAIHIIFGSLLASRHQSLTNTNAGGIYVRNVAITGCQVHSSGCFAVPSVLEYDSLFTSDRLLILHSLVARGYHWILRIHHTNLWTLSLLRFSRSMGRSSHHPQRGSIQ